MAERAAVAASGLVFAFALYQATLNAQPDFFIYRQGAVIGLRGESPYGPGHIRTAVNEQFPNPDAGPDDLQNNCGYFLPPAAVFWYVPFALVPWPVAKVLWAAACGVAAFGVTRLVIDPKLGFARADTPVSAIAWPVLLVVNFVTLAIVLMGQTTLVTVGGIAFGLVCFSRNRPWAGATLWSLAFVKPHVALPLIPLAWFLGGWKRAAMLVLILGIENVLGAVIAGASPLFLGEYLDFLAAGHKAVAFNLAERNVEITSWNRLLFVATGQVIEQTATTTFAGHLVWFGLIVGRCAIANARPCPSWAVAAAAAGSAFVPQVLGYEVLVLALAMPWVREAYANGYRLVGGLGVTLLAAQLIPFVVLAPLGLTFHRPLCVAGFALLVLAGPVNFTHVPARVQPPPADR